MSMEGLKNWPAIQDERKKLRQALATEHGSVTAAKRKREDGGILTSEEKALAVAEGNIGEIIEKMEVSGGDALERLEELNTEVTPAGEERKLPSAETMRAYRELKAPAVEEAKAKKLEQVKKEKLFAELDTSEVFLMRLRKVEYQLIKNPPENLAAKLREGAKLESMARQRLESIANDPHLALYQREYTLTKFTSELRDNNFMVTPSRRVYLDRIEALIEQGKPILLEGHTGTGKSELARMAAHELTGHDPEVISCNPQTRNTDIFGKQSLKNKEGVSVTDTDFGPLTRALEKGQIVIFDEYNELDQRQRQSLKYLFNLRPGDQFDVPGDGKVTVAEGFGMIMTANLKSDKYQEKGNLEAQEARVFQDSSLRVEYTPKEELYDLALASLIDSNGSIMLTESEASETLRQFVDAVADIQEAFSKAIPSYYGTDSALDPKSRKRPGLEKYVLDPGMARRLLTGFQKERMKHGIPLRTFLNQSLRRTLEGDRVSEKDKKLALLIFARYGFLEGKQTGEELGLDYSNGILNVGMPTLKDREFVSAEAFETLSQTEVAKLDPYELRKKMGSDALLNEFGIETQMMVPRQTERAVEAGEMSLGEAESIMGTEHFFGPDDIVATFGDLPESVPPLLTTKEELEKAKKEGQRLVLYTERLHDGRQMTTQAMRDILDNKTSTDSPLFYNDWYLTDNVIASETPRTEWRLVSDECLPGTENKNYLEQTETIAHHLDNNWGGSSGKYSAELDEFTQQKQRIEELMTEDWEQASKELAGLQVNQSFRERFSEVLYRLAIVEKKTGTRLLDFAGRKTYYTWTNSRDASGSLVYVGVFDADGACVDGPSPVDRRGLLGVAFSHKVS